MTDPTSAKLTAAVIGGGIGGLVTALELDAAGFDVRVYEQARAQFSEQELARLSLAIVAINGWNRLCVAFRAQPALRPFPGEAAR